MVKNAMIPLLGAWVRWDLRPVVLGPWDLGAPNYAKI